MYAKNHCIRAGGRSRDSDSNTDSDTKTEIEIDIDTHTQIIVIDRNNEESWPILSVLYEKYIYFLAHTHLLTLSFNIFSLNYFSHVSHY